MTKTINSDLIRGNINTIILKALYSGDRYGYDIIKEIEDKSHGQYILKQPTLYSCLKRLESQGFISSYWGEQSNSNGGRRKYYTLTELGREVFVQNQDEYEYSRTIIDQLISERDYDLDSIEKPTRDDEPEEYEAESRPDTLSDKVVKAISDIESEVVTEEAKPTAETVEAVESTVQEHSEEQSTIQTSNEHIKPQTENIHPNESDVYTKQNEETEETDEESSNNTQTDSTLSADYFGYDPAEFEPITKQSATAAEIDAILSGANDKKSYSDNVSTPASASAPKRSFGESYFGTDDTAASYSPFNYGAAEQYGFALEDETPLDTPNAQPQPASVISETPTIEPQKKSTPDFLSYDTEIPYSSYQPETHRQNPIDDNYRTMLEGFVTDYGAPAEIEKPHEKPLSDEPISETPMSVKEKIQVRNFGKLSQSIRDLGDEVKIRTPDSNAAREYNKQYYYYRNKLLLFQYGILFVIMLLESFITFITIKSSATVEMPYAVALYVCSILFCLAFPITAGILYLSDPFKRKRIDFNFKNSMIFRTIIMLQLILIIYAINVYCGMPLGGSSEYLLSMILPCILTSNVPISGIIFNCLYRSKNFAVD